MLSPDRPRFSTISTYFDPNFAWSDVHKLCLVFLYSARTAQAPNHDYIHADLARRHVYELLHCPRIQPLRCPHFCRHTHIAWPDSLAHSSRRPYNANRIPDHHTARLSTHRARRQAHADRVRHRNITRLDHHQNHQPPRREQHDNEHRNYDMLGNRLELQRHALRPCLPASRDDNLRNDLCHQNSADDLYCICYLQRHHRHRHGFFQGLGRGRRVWVSQRQPCWRGLGW